MNVKICKNKCQKSKNHRFSLGYNAINKQMTIMFSTDDNPACNLVQLQENVDYRKLIRKHPSFISRFMKVSKKCPYYLEHELFDWNRK
jgi:hypothetical protein